ncbi:MAG TPA: hypothetical protein VKA44_04165, partial [Gemmatimonadota bacterium]|nr:hypothetical protein [Gemmatimonadota bacterium]
PREEGLATDGLVGLRVNHHLELRVSDIRILRAPSVTAGASGSSEGRRTSDRGRREEPWVE